MIPHILLIIKYIYKKSLASDKFSVYVECNWIPSVSLTMFCPLNCVDLLVYIYLDKFNRTRINFCNMKGFYPFIILIIACIFYFFAIYQHFSCPDDDVVAFWYLVVYFFMSTKSQISFFYTIFFFANRMNISITFECLHCCYLYKI